MRTKKSILLLVTGWSIVSLPGAAMAAEVGLGYGRDGRSKTDLEQYEIFSRQPLSYTTEWGDIAKLSSAVEFGAAVIHYYGPDDTVTGRFSAIPMIIVSPHENINILAGIGAGFMTGQTDFGEHDLGGSFLLNAKLGLQFLLGDSWGMEGTYYHQSNAGIYDQNGSLNIIELAVTFRF
jgi:hypothetical protein